MPISTKLVVIFTSTNCTLNCKLCSAGVPEYKNKGISFKATPQQIKDSLDELFNLYSHIERFDISGGEPLLWGDENLLDCLKHFEKYKSQFDAVRLLTNGTLCPSEQLLSGISALKYDCSLMVDNYGDLSPAVADIEFACEKYDVPIKIIPYHGDVQWYGGWVDIFGDLTHRHYSSSELQGIFDACHIAHEMVLFLFDGRLYQCPTCPLVEVLYGVDDSKAFIPLLDTDMPLNKKRDIAEQFGNRIPEACNYCNGFDAKNAVRYKAAEQLNSD